MTIVDVLVPVKTKNRTNARMHWRALSASTRHERETVALFLRGKRDTRVKTLTIGGKPRVADVCVDVPFPVVVVLTRISPGTLDDDGVPAALKAVRDEVAVWLGVDDRDPRVEWRYQQAKGKRGACGVRVVVEEARALARPSVGGAV